MVSVVSFHGVVGTVNTQVVTDSWENLALCVTIMKSISTAT